MDRSKKGTIWSEPGSVSRMVRWLTTHESLAYLVGGLLITGSEHNRPCLEYRHGKGRVMLTLYIPEDTTYTEVFNATSPGREDEKGAYWKLTGLDNTFVAFGEMPDILTALKYIDTVYK